MSRRQRLLSVTAAVALCCLGGAVAGAATVAAPWGQTDRDAARSRYNAAERTLTASNVGSVRYLRSLTTPPAGEFGSCSAGVSKTVLSGGRVLILGGTGIDAYDAADGSLVWHRSIAGGEFDYYQDMAVSGGRVFVGEDDCGSASDPNGAIQVFDAATGATLWGSSFVPFGTALNGLVVSGSKVVAAGSSVGSGARVAVYKAGSGAVAWSRRMSNTCPPEPALVVRGLVVYLSCDDQGNVALTASSLGTGAVVWSRAGNWTPLRGDGDTTAAHHLYARSPSGAVVDINPATGATRFTLAGATNVLAVDWQRVYASCDAGVCAYAIASGAPIWSTWATSPLAVAGGVVYTGDGRALNAATGAPLATLFGDPATQLAVGDGRLAVVSDSRIADLYGLAGE